MERVGGGKKKKKKPFKTQIHSSQAAEFSPKAGNRWTGTAAEGAATSMENYAGVCCKQGCQHSAAVLHGATAQCQWMDGLTAHAAHGDAILERNLPGVTPSSQ